ncbi:MAG: hypothetical protein HYZ13_09225 [Acidobacteria bacterium]|nr:hypothetical protein [Acidobacteriota bacterium]
MASTQEAQVFSARDARVVVDGKVVGFCQSITWTVDPTLAEVVCLGSEEVQEHQATVFRIQGTLGQFYIRDILLNPQELGPLGIRTAAEHIRTNTFDLDVLDEVTGEVARHLEGITLGAENASITAGQLVTRQLQFRALRVR